MTVVLKFNKLSFDKGYAFGEFLINTVKMYYSFIAYTQELYRNCLKIKTFKLSHKSMY